MIVDAHQAHRRQREIRRKKPQRRQGERRRDQTSSQGPTRRADGGHVSRVPSSPRGRKISTRTSGYRG